jgi:Peptidase M15
MVNIPRPLQYAIVGTGLTIVLAQHAIALSGHVQGLHGHLTALLIRIENHFGRDLDVTSGCRSRAHNRSIGGAHESWHLSCNAADIKVEGVSKYALANYARGLSGRGGVGIYCSDSSIHIDVGPRREWNWCGGRRQFHTRLAGGDYSYFHYAGRHHRHRIAIHMARD